MSNAPPTPPPTTVTEMEDAEKTMGIASASASSSVQPMQTEPALSTPSTTLTDSYLTAFPQLSDCAIQCEWVKLIELGERAELSGNQAHQTHRSLVAVPLILAYMITDNTQPARHVLDRLSSDTRGSTLVTRVEEILESTIARNHAAVYANCKSLMELTRQATPDEGPLASVVAVMATAFESAFRTRTISLLASCYSSLPLALAENYIGIPAEQLIAEAQAGGWIYDGAMQVLFPPTIVSAKSKKVSSTLSTFDFVASAVSQLEM